MKQLAKYRELLQNNKFKQCLDSGKYTQHVKDDMEGGAKAGIRELQVRLSSVRTAKKSLSEEHYLTIKLNL